MVINRKIKYSCKDISDDLLYLSEMVYEKSENRHVDLTKEYEMLKELIERIDRINKKVY